MSIPITIVSTIGHRYESFFLTLFFTFSSDQHVPRHQRILLRSLLSRHHPTAGLLL